MNKSVSYFLASATICGLIYAWWLGGLDVFLITGYFNVIACSFIALVGAGHFLVSFYKPSIAWLGADTTISLGLLGTIIGLVLALPHISDIEYATKAISLALWTTGVGLTSSIILYIHGYALGAGQEESLQ